jgi:chromosome partitioning protein
LSINDFNEDALTITDLLKDSVENRNKLDYGAAVVLNEKENIYYIPSDINLASADMFLAGAMRREYILKRVLQKEAFGGYDYILVDCLPSLGILLINALTASDSVIVRRLGDEYEILSGHSRGKARKSGVYRA